MTFGKYARDPLIHPTAIIHGNVQLGDDVQVGPYCVLGDDGPGWLNIGAGSHIRSHTVIEACNFIDAHFETGHHVLIRAGHTIGRHVLIGSHSILEGGADIGDRTRIRSRCSINMATIGRGVEMFDGCVLIDGARPPDGYRSAPVVHDGATLAAGVMVMAGVHIGAGAYVAARTLVERDVPADTLLLRSGRLDTVEALR